ncbi:GH92 family glycosyl hydrolase [Bacillus sp. SA1-12]|uniref:GH92 family glycosyl hydrolase n=1 Tax=Bacillus sp. SA1-12 TaxID=1455638 RepID=UPI0006974372|nr:GH92 family glycosyl hydrolase [Bacillus sp. SA1-12]
MSEYYVTPTELRPVFAQKSETTDFFTSFEEGDVQPAWNNSVETDCDGNQRASGVKGAIIDESIQANITHIGKGDDKPINNNNVDGDRKQINCLETESSNMKSQIGNGPKNSYTGKVNAGWTGNKALQYSGRHVAEGRAYSYNKVFEVKITITSKSQLSYYIHPQFMDEKQRDYSSTYVSIDLAFSDGTYLSELGAKDQHGIDVHPQAQGESKTLYPNQWNYKASVIGKVAEGKTVERILIAYDNPSGPAIFEGSIDDIKIEGDPIEVTYKSPVDYVNILRGTNSNGTFSRGNNFPAVAVPHGFNFWTPATDAGSTSWLYTYQQANNSDNLPEIQAFSLSHETSPWMGDRQTFQVMPQALEKPSANRQERALAFKHENEIAKPHYYRVTFENKIKTEITPTDRAAMFKFTFTCEKSSLIFDNVNNDGGLNLHPDDQSITGYTDVKSGLSDGSTRMFIYAVFDKKVLDSGKLTGENRDPVAGYFCFDTSGEDKTVTMKIATSLISVNQARKNLEQEIKPNSTFESLKEDAKKAWEEKLKMIEVEGASNEELVTLYSNMYRLFLYPNIGYENTGTEEKPKYQYASPFSNQIKENTPKETGANIVDGKCYVNNGFWDTYRTSWPAYALLTPTNAGEMINGFIQQYKDGGWISRWSSPGYANLMVGTSSDVAFADAYLKGVTNFDVKAFYESALKNASVASENESVGRKGLATSIFNRYTSTSTGEGLSWAMDGYINDFAIANLARALAKQTDEAIPAYQQYCTDAVYYLERAQNYVELFNSDVKFFMGKVPTGEWRSSPETFNPEAWGGDYTETNAWNMAFHVPQDGQGLANLYGGRAGLAEKLDAFFTIPETASYPGHYGSFIHEMLEARDVRMGMYGHSNQPAHHILYMYNYAGQPAKAQEKIREVLSRLYIGSEIGQGYSGDEDNGEMSAWYLFSAAGFYPLQMGIPEYAIGAPYFKSLTIRLENGNTILVKAPKVSHENKFVQSLKVNGKLHNKLTIDHETLSNGAILEFEMGSEPSEWGTGVEDALPGSITNPRTNGTSLLPIVMYDLTDNKKGISQHSNRGGAEKLFDNTSHTILSLDGTHPWVQYCFENGPEEVLMYTITSGEAVKQDPKSWELLGSKDGNVWKVLDKRENECFPWRKFTKPFSIENPGAYSFYRLEIQENGGAATTSIAQIEMLGYGDIKRGFHRVEAIMQRYVESGEIDEASTIQFSRSLEQYQLGHHKQAIKTLRDFLSEQRSLSEKTKEKLSADLHALIEALIKVTNCYHLSKTK